MVKCFGGVRTKILDIVELAAKVDDEIIKKKTVIMDDEEFEKWEEHVIKLMSRLKKKLKKRLKK